MKVTQIQLHSHITPCICAKALLLKKDCNIPKTHGGLIQLFSLKYLREDKFKYNTYKY